MSGGRTGADPMVVTVAGDQVAGLRARLAETRWPDEVAGSDWDYGTNLAYIRDLVAYWQAAYDWRSHERTINSFANFRVQIDGLGVHFIHERAGARTRCRSFSRTAGRARSSSCSRSSHC